MTARRRFVSRAATVLVAAGLAAACSAEPAQARLLSLTLQMGPGDAGTPADVPLAGDWDGDGIDTVGLYRPSTTLLVTKARNEQSAPLASRIRGNPNDVGVVGRWNAQTTRDVMALYRESALRLFYPPDDSDALADIGLDTRPNRVPVAGDWNGDGTDSIGLWSPTQRNFEVSDSTTTQVFRVAEVRAGEDGDQPLIGDWDGDGDDTLALFRRAPGAASQFYGTVPGRSLTDAPIGYGDGTDAPVVGDWDGDGDTDIGVFKRAEQRFFLETGDTAPPKPGPTPTPGPTPAPSPTADPAPIPLPTSVASPGATPAPAPLNGSGGDPLTGAFVAKLTPKRLIADYLGRALIRGRLVDAAGKAIVGATIQVSQRVALAGAPTTAAATITTDKNGQFVYTAAAVSSRTVEFAFAERAGSTTYRARLSVEVRVKAKVTLKASRPSARRGVAVRFTGRVKIADFPKRGGRVVLEANTGAGWKLGSVVRTSATGAFTWTHAFRNRGRFRVRARLLTSPDIAARPGISRPVAVRIR